MFVILVSSDELNYVEAEEADMNENNFDFEQDDNLGNIYSR